MKDRVKHSNSVVRKKILTKRHFLHQMEKSKQLFSKQQSFRWYGYQMK